MQSTGERILDKLIPRATVTEGQGLNPGNGWTINTVGDTINYSTYIDLAGLTVDHLTLVPIAGTVQEGTGFTHEAAGSFVQVWDIISSQPLPDDFTFANVPGFSSSVDDWSAIIFGQNRIYAVDTTVAAFLRLMHTSSFGSGTPTATDRLYLTRHVVFTVPPPAQGDSISVPASRFVIACNVVEEHDLVHMERLRQSFELQQRGIP